MVGAMRDRISPERQLPIYDLDIEIARAMRRAEGMRLVLSAPTGSGKSTQVPQMLVDNALVEGQIVVLQPRRIAARLLAKRVAEERGTNLGDEVGYQVRFESRCGPKTRIRYVTEGILLRQLLDDPQLNGVGAVIFDEFHERHLYGDITLARARLLQESDRPDLKIAVMSATLDSDALRQYLAPCDYLESEGRVFPVDIIYQPAKERQQKTALWDRAALACEAAVVREEREGDVLVFMPGGYEIRRTIEALQRRGWTRGWQILPLYGELPPGQQDAAVKRYRERKIIVATNVAETSLTIDGVRIVVDGGLARIPSFDPHRGINTLTVQPISQASADQRAGRAGRTAPGLCIRLWDEREHLARAPREKPEIARMDLCEVVLTLKAQRVDDLRDFPWLEAPGERALCRAESLLEDLGAIRGAAAGKVEGGPGAITDMGRRLLAFPVHPRFARMLVEAGRFGCVREACLMAALAQGRGIFVSRKRQGSDLTREDHVREDDVSDFQSLLRGLETARAVDFRGDRCAPLGVNGVAAREAWFLARQFFKVAERSGLEVNDEAPSVEAVAKTILAGFVDQVGARVSSASAVYALVHGRRGRLDKESAVKKADLVVAVEVAEIEGKELQVILSNATALEVEWLAEVFPEHFESTRASIYDSEARRVVARRETRFRDLVIANEGAGDPTDAEAAAILADEVLAGNLKLKQWDHTVDQWITRLELLREWMPELELPGFGESDRRVFLEQMFLGARSYKDIRDRPVAPALKSWLSSGHRKCLEEYAPERVALRNGKSAKVKYEPQGEPSIAVLIQSLYGVAETPRIANGRVPLLVQVLAPNNRPIQVTKDLASFWKSGYPEVKKQLQGRYPKHEWR